MEEFHSSVTPLCLADSSSLKHILLLASSELHCSNYLMPGLKEIKKAILREKTQESARQRAKVTVHMPQ